MITSSTLSRAFHRCWLAVAAVLLTCLTGGAVQAADIRPNIVFVVVDDQPHDAMGFMERYPFLETPNMDRLAREGVQARRAFVTTSLCSPSRASMLSGQYAHTHGVRHNDNTDLPRRAPHLGVSLQQAGYQTAFIGKWHQRASDEPRHGFDHWVGFKNQGVYVDQLLNVNGEHVQTKGYNADVLTDYAVDYIKQSREAPFMLCVWHKAIHAPFTPAERHSDAFTDADLPQPDSWADTFADKPEWLRRGFAHGGWLKKAWLESEGKPVPAAIPPRPWDPRPEKRMDQLRCLLAVDESLGRIMDTLQQTGQLENTIVVFTSDNGYFFGEHRRQDKRLAYEESMRIPLLVRYPRSIAAGSTVDELLLNIDFAPTLLDMAGVDVPAAMQGRSFAPLLAGQGVDDWRQSFLYAYFAEPWWLPGIPSILAVRDQRWKYIHHPDDPEQVDELYDLLEDPAELVNLAQDPAHADTLTRLRAEMARLREETDFRLHKPTTGVDDIPLTAMLRWDFANVEGKTVLDSTGKSHNGQNLKAKAVNGRRGVAYEFDGDATVRLGQPPASLDPAGKPLTLSTWVKPTGADGVIASYGGPVAGFSLYLEGGRPVFATRSKHRLSRAVASQALALDRWYHLVAVLAADGQLRLYVDGETVAEGQGKTLHVKPGIGFTAGNDVGQPVSDYRGETGYHGLIEDLRLYWGAAAPVLIGHWAEDREVKLHD